MSDQSRRDLLRGAAATALVGSLDPLAAQHVHETVASQKAAGTYQPKVFTTAEWKTVQVLCELIVPGAASGNAAEFIDTIASANPALAAAWTGGIAWLNARANGSFSNAAPAAQTQLLNQIAFRKNDSPELAPGIGFFDLARRMTVDAYYTSKAGIAEIGYQGNKGMSEFKVPEEAVAYVMRRSPFA